jgi:predicted nucleic acid-binding protein
MRVLLLDTNVVSILFKPDHNLYKTCFEVAAGSQWFISFMTQAELLLWPRLNRWGAKRREELNRHIGLCTTLLADETTCALWADIMTESQAAGRPVTFRTLGWLRQPSSGTSLALVTADFRDFEHLDALTLIPIS